MEKQQLYMIGGVVGVCILAFAGIMLFAPKPIDYSTKTTREIALACTTDMATQFHIHPMLKIIVNGKNVEIPSQIGIVDGCMNAIHTHDATGQLHVEAPVKKDFTLGDFFAVWNKPFSPGVLIDNVADADHPITMTVNGEATTTYGDTVLHDLDQIVIKYGK